MAQEPAARAQAVRIHLIGTDDLEPHPKPAQLELQSAALLWFTLFCEPAACDCQLHFGLQAFQISKGKLAPHHARVSGRCASVAASLRLCDALSLSSKVCEQLAVSASTAGQQAFPLPQVKAEASARYAAQAPSFKHLAQPGSLSPHSP